MLLIAGADDFASQLAVLNCYPPEVVPTSGLGLLDSDHSESGISAVSSAALTATWLAVSAAPTTVSLGCVRLTCP